MSPLLLNWKCLLLGRKAMTNLDSILKSRDITWLTKVRIGKAMVFWGVRDWCERSQKRLKVEVAQSHPTLCDPVDCIVHGILQVRILEQVAYPFSRGSSWPRNQTGVSFIAGGLFTNCEGRLRAEELMLLNCGTGKLWRVPCLQGNITSKS